MLRNAFGRIVIAGGLLALAPEFANASEYPIGFWRYMGFGTGPGYHAHNCCAGPCGPNRGHRPYIQPWHPHLTDNASPADQPQLARIPAPQSVAERPAEPTAPPVRTATRQPATQSPLQKFFSAR